MQSWLGGSDRHVFGVWLESRSLRAAERGDLPLRTAASRALARVRRDAARRMREFVAAEIVASPAGSA
jgi:hypothetical protein